MNNSEDYSIIEDAFKFVVEDYKKKNGYDPIKNAHIIKYAYDTSYQGEVYYILFSATNERSAKVLYFQSAVWEFPEDHFQCVTVEDYEKNDEIRVQEDKDQHNEREVEKEKGNMLGNWVVEKEVFMKKELRFIETVDMASMGYSDFTTFYLTMLVGISESYSSPSLFQAKVYEYKRYEQPVLESTGLKLLCKESFPEWIKLHLLQEARFCFAREGQILKLEVDGSYLYLSKTYDSVSNIFEIAQQIGDERTRNDVIPFLCSNNEDVDDNVLWRIAEKIGQLLPYVGMTKYVYVLVSALEYFCTVASPSVREEAEKSLSVISREMMETDIQLYLTPMVMRLAHFQEGSGRASACSLFSIVYRSASNDVKIELIYMYAQLCRDELAIVKKSAASSLVKIASTVDMFYYNRLVLFSIPPLLSGEPAVRLAFVKCLKPLLELSKSDIVGFKSYCVDLLPRLCEDPFWHVRYIVAKEVLEHLVVDEHVRSHQVSMYVGLLQDSHKTVRKAAVGLLTKMYWMLNLENHIGRLLELIKELSVDPFEGVRSALSSEIVGFTAVVRDDSAVMELLQVIGRLLTDKCPIVRLNIICTIDKANKVIVSNLSTALLATALDLSKHDYCDIRREVTEYIPVLANLLGERSVLRDCCTEMLKDQYFFVRDEAQESLKRLAELGQCA